MVKRPASAPSTPRRKRSKVSTDQAVLDNYFRGSPNPYGRGASKGKHKATDAGTLGRDSNEREVLFMTCSPEGLDPHREHPRQGTRAQPIQLDSDVETEVASKEEPRAGPSHVVQDALRSSTPSSRVYSEKPGKDRGAADQKVYVQLASNGPSTSGESLIVSYSSVGVDPLLFPIDKRPWAADSPAPYSFLVNTLVALSETRSRIAILNSLSNTLRCLLLYHPASLLPALYLLSNSLSPPYSPIELGIGGSVISKAIQHISGFTGAALRKLYNSSGDPGDVAYEAKSNVRTLIPHPPLLIGAVYESLLKIAQAKGPGAAKEKQSIVERLLVAAKGEEARYLVRTLSLNLRVGAVRTSILTALARALVLTAPSNLTSPISEASPYHASSKFLAAIEPFPENTKRKVNDARRDELSAKCASAEALVKQVYVQHPNFDHIVAGLFEGGLDGLSDRVPLTVGIPLHPTLGSPTRSLDEIYERLNDMPFTAEFKYDGQRAQIHASRLGDDLPSVRIFSRHLENMTTKYPDVVSLFMRIFQRVSNLKSLIIDSEIAAIDPNDGSIRSFQELSNRAKKDVELGDIKVSVCVFVFDLMYLDGEILLERPFRERRGLLRTRFPPLMPDEKGVARLDHVESCESEEGRDVIEGFWQKAVDSRCEGLMIKLLDCGEVQEEIPQQKGKTRKKPLPATYEPDKRTSAWLKLKKDYVEGIGDTLDLVPVGAWYGNGRKAGWWSPLLLAVWDPTAEKLVAVCKCMSGFSDVFYKDVTSRYVEGSDNCSREPLWVCETGGFRPDVFFRPHEVWEIRGADVTLSPVSLAALGEVSPVRGLSLRFPRFIRVRSDKSPEQASTSQFLAQMWRDQQGKGKDQTGTDDGDLVDMELEADAEVEEGSDS
ncbi:ATP-dependent DNA ligase [Phlebopus sp. FC_14]|nr:ATP-dependent DNA ligase [Phlebopus sp. FC_14]